MRIEDFGEWTSAGAGYRAGRRSRARTALLLCGLALLAFGAVSLLLELRGPAAGEATPARSAALWLTIPKMNRVDNLPVSTAPSGQESALRNGPVRMSGTGLPWQKDSNVYISGHRLGYPGTNSFLVFRDLNVLREGDRVILRDDKGRRYYYRVFGRRVVEPGDLSVTKPVAGRGIISLQTCTLPNYHQRLVIRAKLVKSSQA